MLLLVVGRVQSGHMEGWTVGQMMVCPNKLIWPLLVSSDDAHFHAKTHSPGLSCLYDDADLLSCLHDDTHLHAKPNSPGFSCLHGDAHLLSCLNNDHADLHEKTNSPGLSCLHDDAHLHAQLLFNQMMVHCSHSQQGPGG